MGDEHLSVEAASDLAEVMQGLASSTRLLVVARLRQGARDVTSLSRELEISQATLSNHLRVLRHAHLVKGTRVGRSIVYSLFDDHVAAFVDEALMHLSHTR